PGGCAGVRAGFCCRARGAVARRAGRIGEDQRPHPARQPGHRRCDHRDAAQGQPEELTATADAKGEFTSTFSHTSAAGTYRVEAASPGGRERGAATFAVVSPAGFAGELQDEEEALSKTTAESVETAQA